MGGGPAASRPVWYPASPFFLLQPRRSRSRGTGTQDALPADPCDPELLAYKERTSHSTDAQGSIQRRHDLLLRKFFEAVPDIEPKDDQRLLSSEQRLAIVRRDGGQCQVRLRCSGAKCEWDAWQAHHMTAWSTGGKTTVENGQVACPACNAAKGAVA